MGGLFGGGAPKQAQEPTRYKDLQIQTSAYGVAIPIVYGRSRLAPNLIWYGDFLATPHQQDMGGKGGMGAQQGNTTYTYSCSLCMALCEGPIGDLLTVWKNKSKNTNPTQWTDFLGTYPQAAWSHLTSDHPTEALGYNGIAYAARTLVNLGETNTLASYGMEVRGVLPYDHAGGIDDADPSAVLVDFLSNAYYGAGFPAAKIAALTNYHNFCVAASFFLSPVIQSQRSAAEWVKDLLDMTDSACLWSEGTLKIIPLCDSAVTGNGHTFTPSLSAVAALTEDDFKAPVKVIRRSPQDVYNQVQVEYLDRSNDYRTAISDRKDDAHISNYGLRTQDPIQCHACTTAVTAAMVAQLKLQQSVSLCNEYEAVISPRHALLEPGDIVSLTDTHLGLSAVLVRITEFEEDGEDEGFRIRAEELKIGTHTITAYTDQAGSGYGPDDEVDPGNADTPAIIEPPAVMTDGAKELWIATAGGANWGGCNVWVSYTAGGTYTQIGTIYGKSRYGTLSAQLDAAHATFPTEDTAHTCSVDLSGSEGTLATATADERDMLQTLLYVDGEILGYETATLTSAYHYDLTHLIRGVFGTGTGIHALGAAVVRLDERIGRFPWRLEKGKTLYVKLQSFNLVGGGLQDLSALSPSTHVVTGLTIAAPTLTLDETKRRRNLYHASWTANKNLRKLRVYKRTYAASPGTPDTDSANWKKYQVIDLVTDEADASEQCLETEGHFTVAHTQDARICVAVQLVDVHRQESAWVVDTAGTPATSDDTVPSVPTYSAAASSEDDLPGTKRVECDLTLQYTGLTANQEIEVQVRDSTGAKWVRRMLVTGSSMNIYYDSQFKRGTTVYFKARALNGTAYSAWTAESNIVAGSTTGTAPADWPGAPIVDVLARLQRKTKLRIRPNASDTAATRKSLRLLEIFTAPRYSPTTPAPDTCEYAEGTTATTGAGYLTCSGLITADDQFNNSWLVDSAGTQFRISDTTLATARIDLDTTATPASGAFSIHPRWERECAMDVSEAARDGRKSWKVWVQHRDDDENPANTEKPAIAIRFRGNQTNTGGDWSYVETELEAYLTLDSLNDLEVEVGCTASGGTTPYRYTWDFGDGTQISNTTDASPTHTYDAADVYTVLCTVKDAKGAAVQASIVIYVGGTVVNTADTICGTGDETDAQDTLAGLPRRPQVAWTNKTNIQADDDTLATCALPAASYSKALKATNFGFSLGTVIKIKGVKVTVQAKTSSGTKTKIASIQLVVGGNPAGIQKEPGRPLTTSLANYSFGNGADLWGITSETDRLTKAQVEASDFGAIVTFVNDGDSASRTVSVDFVSIIVYYDDGT